MTFNLLFLKYQVARNLNAGSDQKLLILLLHVWPNHGDVSKQVVPFSDLLTVIEMCFWFSCYLVYFCCENCSCTYDSEIQWTSCLVINGKFPGMT